MHDENAVKRYWIYFGAGWFVVAVATMFGIASGITREEIFTIALFAALTLFLLFRKDVPHRQIGIATSWIIPLIVLLWAFIYIHYFKAIELSSPANPSTADVTLKGNALVWRLTLQGIISSLFFGWVAVGYGLVPPLAFAMTIASLLPKNSLRSLSPEKLEKWKHQKPYQNRWAWGAVMLIFVLKMSLAFSVYRINKKMAADLQEIEQRIESRKKIP